MRILITSGGTKIPIDRVRHIANMSSGTFGAKIAYEALQKEHSVIFFKAQDSKSPFTMNIDLVQNSDGRHLMECVRSLSNNYNTFKDLYTEIEYTEFSNYMSRLEFIIKQTKPDVIVLAAAVSDYGVANYVDGKIRSKDAMTINLEPLPKVISKIKEWSPTAKLVGFKLLVDSTENELIEAAKDSILRNYCDLVVANDLRDIKNNKHQIFLVSIGIDGKYSHETFISDPLDSNYLARKVIERIETL